MSCFFFLLKHRLHSTCYLDILPKLWRHLVHSNPHHCYFGHHQRSWPGPSSVTLIATKSIYVFAQPMLCTVLVILLLSGGQPPDWTLLLGVSGLFVCSRNCVSECQSNPPFGAWHHWWTAPYYLMSPPNLYKLGTLKKLHPTILQLLFQPPRKKCENAMHVEGAGYFLVKLECIMTSLTVIVLAADPIVRLTSWWCLQDCRSRIYSSSSSNTSAPSDTL